MDPIHQTIDRCIEGSIVGRIDRAPHVGRAESRSPHFFDASNQAMSCSEFSWAKMRYRVLEGASLDTTFISKRRRNCRFILWIRWKGICSRYPIATKTSDRIEQRGLSKPDVILDVRGKSEGYRNSRFAAVSVN